MENGSNRQASKVEKIVNAMKGQIIDIGRLYEHAEKLGMIDIETDDTLPTPMNIINLLGGTVRSLQDRVLQLEESRDEWQELYCHVDSEAADLETETDILYAKFEQAQGRIEELEAEKAARSEMVRDIIAASLELGADTALANPDVFGREVA